MLIHLENFIDHGSIDNRTQGIVHVKLWFKNEGKPMEANLRGDCLRDIAGCLVQFSAKAPESTLPQRFLPFKLSGLMIPGLAGDITASRRQCANRKDPAIYNYLYFEFFSDDKGLFVLEANNLITTVSLPSWSMDEGDEQVILMSNQQIMRDYVATWIKQYSLIQEDKHPLPDHRWDIRLREAEGAAIAYSEIQRKYSQDPTGEASEAFIMGWDTRLGQLANSDETGNPYASCASSGGALSLFDVLTEEESIEAQLGMTHPLFQKILTLTQMSQRVFSAHLGDNSPDVQQLFDMIRYITPNIFSCILQLNENNGINYSVLAQRMSRCVAHIEAGITSIARLNDDHIDKMKHILAEVHHDTLSMQNDFAKQVKH
ncbi:MAG: hypothetical protein RR373_05155 [Akkermansia sp.]